MNRNERAIIRSNILSGLTVGIVALPLSMALAIAVGAPPQHGLYTAIVAGIVIAIAGSSKVSVSGPTAAFVVILLPITERYGLGGLLVSGLMAGFILIALGTAKLGGLIKYVPYPVTVGFTAGIGMVIATIQVNDFLGLSGAALSGNYIEKVYSLIRSMPTFQWNELFISVITMLFLILWPRIKSRLPSHLVALCVGGAAAWILGDILGYPVSTIGSRFQYVAGEMSGWGIPPVLPRVILPWELPDASGNPIGLSYSLVSDLTGSAFAIALLGALESLLCAVIADGMSGTKTDPNRELIGQGLGNIIAPFFGGIPATAALARTATNIRAGGTRRISSVVHALFILISILVLSPVLAYIPMASMAALLIVVAWNMSEAKHFFHIIRSAQSSDVAVLLTCFALTVLVDMEVAVAVGLGLAGLLFIKRTIELTNVNFIANEDIKQHPCLTDEIAVYDINGPMFFGAAEKALNTLSGIRKEIKVVILDMKDVTMIDATASVAMGSIIKNFESKGIAIIISNLEARLILGLRKAGIRKRIGNVEFVRNMADGVKKAFEILASKEKSVI